MLTRRLDLYQCPVCETVVEVLNPGGVELTCCGPPMAALPQNSVRPGSGHECRVRTTARGVRVRIEHEVRATDHDHRIAWIDVWCGGACLRKFVDPGQAPEAEFPLRGPVEAVRFYCTMHGLWRSSAKASTTRAGKFAAPAVSRV